MNTIELNSIDGGEINVKVPDNTKQAQPEGWRPQEVKS